MGFEKEWNKVANTIGVATLPTILYKENYITPGRNFQNPDHTTRFFVGNPATAGYGLTLTQANLVVYYANDFNLDTRQQSEDRCHRIGQDKSVLYIDLLCEGTIDEKIIKSLKDKIKIGAKVLGEDEREWLEIKQMKMRLTQK